MKAIAPTVVVYAAGRERALIIDALRGRAQIAFVETYLDMRRRLAGNPSVWLVVLPARDSEGIPAAPVVRAIARDCPETAIVVSCKAGIEFSADIRALATAGAHKFLFTGVDDTVAALRNVLDAAVRESAAEVVLRRLRCIVPERLHDFIDCCVSQPHAVRTVNDVAALLGLHRKTLFNHCQGIAPGFGPEELLSWCRVILVSYRLQTPGRTVEAISIEMDFASVSALRNLVKRYTGMSATGLREAGGLGPALAAFRKRLAIEVTE